MTLSTATRRLSNATCATATSRAKAPRVTTASSSLPKGSPRSSRDGAAPHSTPAVLELIDRPRCARVSVRTCPLPIDRQFQGASRVSRFRVSVDIGGTFTDFVIHDQEAGRAFTGKVLSTPRNPAEGVISGLTHLIADPRQIEFIVHGTTVGLECLSGAAWHARPAHHDRWLQGCLHDCPRGPEEALRSPLRQAEATRPSQRHPPCPRASAVGWEIQMPLCADDFDPIVEKIEAEAIDAVAICFLHANVNPIHELEATTDYPGTATSSFQSPSPTKSRASGGSTSAPPRSSSTPTSHL